MKEDTLPKTVLETTLTPIRGKETREDIILMLQRIMNLPQRESNKKVMKNMFSFSYSQELPHIEAMISL